MSDGPHDMAALERREAATDPRALLAATDATARAREILTARKDLADTVLWIAEGVAMTAVNAAIVSVPGGPTVQAVARELAALAIEEAAQRARRG